MLLDLSVAEGVALLAAFAERIGAIIDPEDFASYGCSNGGGPIH